MKSTVCSLTLILMVSLLACNTQSQQEESASTDNMEQADTMGPTPQVKGEEISYEADDITMEGYIAYDENMEGSRPGVLVIHEWWGHNEYVRARADELAQMGYVALALDMYGDGKTAAHPEDAGKFSSAVMQNMEGAKARFAKALETLKNHPMCDSTRTAAIGYCFGGSVALTMANAGFDLDGVAAFHSGLQLPVMPEAGAVQAKVLVCNGADDPFIPAEQIESFKTAMDEASVDYEYHAYEGAVHGFTNPGADSLGQKFDLPLAYDAEADEKSWQELKDLFAEIF